MDHRTWLCLSRPIVCVFSVLSILVSGFSKTEKEECENIMRGLEYLSLN